MSASTPYAGTQIGPDGQRYTTGEIPDGLSDVRTLNYLRVHGTPDKASIIWVNPDTDLATWVDVDTVIDFAEPSS